MADPTPLLSQEATPIALADPRRSDTHHLDPARLDPFVVERAGLRLLRDGVDTGTDAQQLKLLWVLIDAWPGVVSKDELLDKVWGGHVSEAALHKTVSLLRKRLHALGDGKEFIRTRHRHGYQLLVEPMPLDAEAGNVPESVPSVLHARASSSRWTALWVALSIAMVLTALAASQLLRPALPLPEPASAERVAPSPLPVDALAEHDNPALLQLARDATPSDLALAAAAADTLRARIDANVEPGLAGLARKQAGLVAYHRGDYRDAVALFEAAISPLQTAEDWVELANVLGNIGASWVELGDLGPQTETRYREALDIWTRLDDAAGMARTYNNLVNLHLKRAQPGDAEHDLDALTKVVARLDDPAWDVRVDVLRGDLLDAEAQSGAQDAYASALALATRSGHADLAAVAAQRLARLAERANDLVLAYRWLTQARQHYEAAGSRGQLPQLDYALAANRERAGHASDAIAHYESVLDALAPQASPQLRADTESGIARLLAERGEHDAARQRLQHAARDARLSGDALALTSVLIGQGFHLLAAGESAVAAVALAREAEVTLGTRDSWSHRRNILALSGLALAATEHVEEALMKASQLRAEAIRRDDLPSLAQADTIEAAAHLMRGDFAPGYQALRRTRANPELLATADAGSPATPATQPSTSGSRSSWLILALLPMAYVAGRLSRH